MNIPTGLPNKPIRDALRLDIGQIMEELVQRGQCEYHADLRIDRGHLVIGSRTTQRKLAVSLDWPTDPEEPTMGLIFITVDSQNTTQVMHMGGIPTRLGGRRWRLLCPVTGRVTKLVYFSRDKYRFVSRRGYDREMKRVSVSRILSNLKEYEILLAHLGFEDGSGGGKPAAMSDEMFQGLNDAVIRNMFERMSIVHGLPEMESVSDLFTFAPSVGGQFREPKL